MSNHRISQRDLRTAPQKMWRTAARRQSSTMSEPIYVPLILRQAHSDALSTRGDVSRYPFQRDSLSCGGTFRGRTVKSEPSHQFLINCRQQTISVSRPTAHFTFSTAFHRKICKSCDEQPLLRIQKVQTGNMHHRPSRTELSAPTVRTLAPWQLAPYSAISYEQALAAQDFAPVDPGPKRAT